MCECCPGGYVCVEVIFGSTLCSGVFFVLVLYAVKRAKMGKECLRLRAKSSL